MAFTVVQANITPTANTVTDLFTVPAGKKMAGVTIMIANTGTADQVFSVAMAPAGAADDPKHYYCTNMKVLTGTMVPFTLPAAMQGGDKVRVKTDGSAVNFAVFSSAA